MSNTIEIPLNKSKAIKQFILLVLLLLLFSLMAIQPQLFVKSGGAGFIKICGYIGTFFCVIFTAFVAQKVFNKKPGLIMSNDGFIDNSMGVMFLKVRWTEVTGITHLESEGKRYIKVSIRDAEKYITSESNTVKRKMLELNYGTLKTPINIAASKLKMDFDALFSLINEEFEKHK